MVVVLSNSVSQRNLQVACSPYECVTGAGVADDLEKATANSLDTSVNIDTFYSPASDSSLQNPDIIRLSQNDTGDSLKLRFTRCPLMVV